MASRWTSSCRRWATRPAPHGAAGSTRPVRPRTTSCSGRRPRVFPATPIGQRRGPSWCSLRTSDPGDGMKRIVFAILLVAGLFGRVVAAADTPAAQARRPFRFELEAATDSHRGNGLVWRITNVRLRVESRVLLRPRLVAGGRLSCHRGVIRQDLTRSTLRTEKELSP